MPRSVHWVLDTLVVPDDEVVHQQLHVGERGFRSRPGVEVMWTSAGQGDGSPIAFYERYGFEQTGEIVFHNEVLLRLRIS